MQTQQPGHPATPAPRMRVWAIVSAVAILIAALLLVLPALTHVLGLRNEVTLPLLAIAGVLVLLGALALVSIAFSLMDMGDRQEAFALPSGSIRAVIALSLVVLFAILAVFLFSSLGESGRVEKLPCLTQAQKDTFERNLGSQVLLTVESSVSDKGEQCSGRAPAPSETTKKVGETTGNEAPRATTPPPTTTPIVPPTTQGAPPGETTGPSGAPPGGTPPSPSLAQSSPGGSGVPSPPTQVPQAPGAATTTAGAGQSFFTIYYRNISDASHDFAKQLLVLIGTLVTAVASFYFGAKAVSDGQAAAAPNPPPNPGGIDPHRVVQSDEPQKLTITGSDLNSVARAQLTKGTDTITGTDLLSNPTKVQAALKIPVENRFVGKWDVVVADAVGRTARLPEALEVTAPAGQAVGQGGHSD